MLSIVCIIIAWRCTNVIKQQIKLDKQERKRNYMEITGNKVEIVEKREENRKRER